MPRKFKPLALHFNWNADLSISIFAQGKLVQRYNYSPYGACPKGSAEAFAKGWFGDEPQRIRWTFSPTHSHLRGIPSRRETIIEKSATAMEAR